MSNVNWRVLNQIESDWNHMLPPGFAASRVVKVITLVFHRDRIKLNRNVRKICRKTYILPWPQLKWQSVSQSIDVNNSRKRRRFSFFVFMFGNQSFAYLSIGKNLFEDYACSWLSKIWHRFIFVFAYFDLFFGLENCTL